MIELMGAASGGLAALCSPGQAMRLPGPYGYAPRFDNPGSPDKL
jgi:hypothetical protein